MRIILCCLLVLGASVSGEIREKRQASYTFPGPRSEAANRQAAAAVYRAQQEQRGGGRAYVAEEQEDGHLYPATRRQYQEQPAQYTPSQGRSQAPQAAPEAPVYEAPRPAARQTYSSSNTQRKKASASSRANKYGGSAPQQALNGGADDDDVEPGPDPLTLLLEDSKFTCGGKTDGYYADDSVNCQVFHYCVSGARHSWMCPDGTVFHQVHLNCVPDSQDICAQSQKFHFVNDYLYKPVDYQGPNNTARYAQRYYPDGYVVGDPLVAPHENQAAARPAHPPAPSYRAQPVQSYPAPAPAPVSRPAARPVAPPPPPPPPPQQQQQQSYREPAQPARYGHAQALAAARGVRPSRPAYDGEVPQGYRGSPRQEPQPQAIPVQDDVYQPQPEARRPVAAPRGGGGYASPRQQPQPQQYRPANARSSGARPQYPGYASNQAAGVQYDEDY